MFKNPFEILLPNFKKPLGIKGEAAICIEIADWLREMSLSNPSFPYVWFHVPNQFTGKYRGLYGAILAWMGKISGVADYVFISRTYSCFIEVKTKKGNLSPNQIIFKKWCESLGIDYFKVTTLEEVKSALKLS